MKDSFYFPVIAISNWTDISFQYLKFFSENDEENEQIRKGELKKMLIQTVQIIKTELQVKLLKQFMT